LKYNLDLSYPLKVQLYPNKTQKQIPTFKEDVCRASTLSSYLRLA